MPRLLLLLLCLLPVAATAAEEGQTPVLIWRAAGSEGVSNDVLGGVTLTPAAKGAFVDTRVDLIGSQRFKAVYQVFDSNAASPMGRCGAGHEIHLFVYELIPPTPCRAGQDADQ